MNVLELQKYGVSELETREMRDTNGGSWFWPIVVGAIVYEIVSDWEHFKDGFNDAIN